MYFYYFFMRCFLFALLIYYVTMFCQLFNVIKVTKQKITWKAIIPFYYFIK